MSHWESEYVNCPYYHRHENKAEYKISCEGVDGADSLSLNFHSSKERTAYTRKYCEDLKGCKRCVLHQALNIKYGVLNEL